jgi:lipoate-protein ligase A
MQLVDLTLESPAENLALDEALLDEAEQSEQPREFLRLWESSVPIVVVGRSSQVSLEVNLDACRVRGVGVLRRTSGGAAIVAGPGSLMYAVVLSYDLRPALRSLDEAHRFVLDTQLSALRPLVPRCARRGTSDLVMQMDERSDVAATERKFSGNSVRCKRHHFLYHGTLLYDFDLRLIDELLLMPPRQPEYRQGRPHNTFVANLPASRNALRQTLVSTWAATAAGTTWQWPRERVEQLVATRYGHDDWNLQR